MAKIAITSAIILEIGKDPSFAIFSAITIFLFTMLFYLMYLKPSSEKKKLNKIFLLDERISEVEKRWEENPGAYSIQEFSNHRDQKKMAEISGKFVVDMIRNNEDPVKVYDMVMRMGFRKRNKFTAQSNNYIMYELVKDFIVKNLEFDDKNQSFIVWKINYPNTEPYIWVELERDTMIAVNSPTGNSFGSVENTIAITATA